MTQHISDFNEFIDKNADFIKEARCKINDLIKKIALQKRSELIAYVRDIGEKLEEEVSLYVNQLEKRYEQEYFLLKEQYNRIGQEDQDISSTDFRQIVENDEEAKKDITKKFEKEAQELKMRYQVLIDKKISSSERILWKKFDTKKNEFEHYIAEQSDAIKEFVTILFEDNISEPNFMEIIGQEIDRFCEEFEIT